MESGNTRAGTSAAGAGADAAAGDPGTAPIVLLAGAVKVPDRVGHHDYLAGCALLAFLLEQTAGVRAIVVSNGWPADERVLDAARALVFYSGGGRKQAVLGSAQRVERLQRVVDGGVGIVMVHQAVSFPPELAHRAASWIGGAHVPGKSARGHWTTHHRAFPAHPVTRGVEPWKIRDGWLTEIQFTHGMRGVTPVVWSSREHRGASEGSAGEVASWTYDRPDGGRSFCFTGLDAHSAWSAPGVRRLMVNGTLWSAGLTVPDAGAPCAVDPAALQRYLTPRGSRSEWILEVLRRGFRRWAR